jgi:hypothetical protein
LRRREMKKLLLQLDSDKHPSVFDTITAYDAGADHVLALGDVAVKDVRDLVYGAMFTRGGEALKNSAVFIGGSDVPTGEVMLREVLNTFFGPVRVSVMADPNGSNTTAAAAVVKITQAVPPAGKRAVVFAGTGPVGLRACAFLAREGADVHLTSRSMERAKSACELVKSRFNLEVTPHQVADGEAAKRVLEGAHILMSAGVAGVTLVGEDIWKANPTIEVMADVNAVPPTGIEGIKPHWDGKEKEGKVIFGALGVGGLKMKVHRACVARLFTANDLVLDAEEIYGIAKGV